MISNKEKNFVSAVIYIHNDETGIELFCSKLCDVLDKNFEKYEIIFVNDCSKDESINLIKQFAQTKKNSVISLINMSIYQGVELAMNAGVDLTIGDFVFEFDTVALDYNQEIIMDVYKHSLKGYDIVSAVPDRIALTSKLFYAVFNRYSDAKYNLQTERFRILSRRAINRVQSLSKIISYRKASYANSGLSIDSLFYKSIFKGDRINKTNFQTRKETAFDSLILFTDIAYKFSITLTTLLFFFTLFAGIYTLATYLGDKKPIEGWTTTMLLLAGGFSGVFMVFAIIIKYLSILVNLVLKKQKYLIESIEKLQ